MLDDHALKEVIDSIDAEIQQRRQKGSGGFGIKMGPCLFKALQQKGLIKKEKYGLLGTRLLACDQYAYRRVFAVHRCDGMGDYEHKLGKRRLRLRLWVPSSPPPP